jgi:tetratricopeptide (TPR) repeat protein
MRGLSNASRLAWRDWRIFHRHRRHFTFIFFDPFFPFFAYAPFFNYYAAPAPYYPYPFGYTWTPMYGGAAPYAEIAPSYLPPTNPREQAEPDELAAAKSGAEIYPFARQAEEAFRARDYKTATRAWRHAIVDDPNNGALLLRLAQALLAAGEYDEAAGATQQALMLLPEEKWQPELSNATKLYANPQDYKDQLKGLERAVKENPDNPALRFELGFQYGFSGRRAEALRELDKLLQIAPQDQLGRRLKDLLAGKIAGEKGTATRAGQSDQTASIK